MANTTHLERLASDEELIAIWRDRLERGEPWSDIELEVLQYTGGCAARLLVLVMTAWLVIDEIPRGDLNQMSAGQV